VYAASGSAEKQENEPRYSEPADDCRHAHDQAVVAADDCCHDRHQALVRDRKSEHLWHLSQRNNAAREVPRQNGLILSLVVLKLSLTLAPSLARVCKL
jgi:hypothetical protein